MGEDQHTGDRRYLLGLNQIGSKNQVYQRLKKRADQGVKADKNVLDQIADKVYTE